MIVENQTNIKALKLSIFMTCFNLPCVNNI